jgi:Predicted membrane protein (DUF2142)
MLRLGATASRGGRAYRRPRGGLRAFEVLRRRGRTRYGSIPRRQMPRRSPLVLVGLGLALLLAAWVVATQPFNAPDEVSHYLRAVGISNGQLLGPKVGYPAPQLPPAQLAWAQQGTRGVMVTAPLAPPDVNCVTGRPDTGNCEEPTEAGNYHPLPYLLPAAAIRVSGTAYTALWLSRAASAVQCFFFLILAAALLWDGSAWSLIGLLAAITPMVLFVSSVVNPNGLEVAAALAFAAGVLRLSRAPARASPWVWAGVSVSGLVTILAWQLGPVFVAADLLLLAGLLGRPGVRELVAGGGRSIWIASAILTLAAVVWLAYGLASGVEHSHFTLGLPHGLSQLVAVLKDSVGNFGTLTVHLPVAARWIWWLLVLALVGVALSVGDPRERVVLIVTAALVLAFPILFYAWVYRSSGFGMQGRYVLPVIVLIPLVAGELIRRHTDRLPLRAKPRLARGSLIVLIAGFQAYAWWYDASNVAGAPRGLRFYAHAAWSPPLGWLPWTAVAALGTLALLAFAATETFGRSGPGLAPAGRPIGHASQARG